MQIDSTVNRFHTAFRTSLGMGLTNALRRKAGKKQKKQIVVLLRALQLDAGTMPLAQMHDRACNSR
jgi:hypothetical protein